MPKKYDTYEKALARLEEIVTSLEKGDLELEEALKLFEEGTKLSTECYERLSKAEQKIVELNGEKQ